MKGKYVKRDIAKAYEYAKKASDQGDMFGRALLGAYYMNVKKDVKLGIKLIQESAKKGNAGGQYMLYRCLYYRKGIKKDRKKARELLQKAADQGQSDAATKWRLMNGK